jgi:SAM-dependent methyltransferase
MDALAYLNEYYSTHNELQRLGSRHGQVEFLTTVRYVERYLVPGMKILEIGAGPGRYAHYFARKGYAVDAVELIPHNIEVFSSLTEPGENVTIMQGDARDLSAIPSERYDATLLLGPMYHLYTEEDKLKALSEALRVTRVGGIVYAAYCIADASILRYGFLGNNIDELVEKNLMDIETFEVISSPAELFELYRKSDIDALMSRFDTERLHYVATDGYTRHMAEAIDAMDDRIFGIYLNYHYKTCERPDMVGLTNHSLDIFRKR